MEELNLDEKIYKQSKNYKSLIKFNKLNKYFLFPILFAIFYFISNLFEELIDQTEVIKKGIFIKSIAFDLPNIFAGLFYFISCSKDNDDEENYQSNTIAEHYYKEEIKKIGYIIKSKKNIMLIILLSLMSVINDFLCVLIKGETIFEERLFYLFFIPLFSKIILKENIYKHQYFSLLISLIGSIFLIIPICFDLKNNSIIPNILNVIKGINYPLFLVLIKYLVEKSYIPPLKVCLVIGIISIIINVIGYTIYCLIIYDFSLFTDCLDFSLVEKKSVIIIYFIMYFLFLTASQLTLYLSISYFSPTLINVTAIISTLLLWIAKAIFLKYTPKIEIIFNPIGYIIALISTFIYNELIIFNCCGFNKNIKIFVNKKIYEEP